MGTKKRKGNTKGGGVLPPEIRYFGPGYEETQRQLDEGADPRVLQTLGFPVAEDGGPDSSVAQFRKATVADRPKRWIPNEPDGTDDSGTPISEPLHLRYPDVYVEVDEDGVELDVADPDDRPGVRSDTGAEVIAIDADVAFAPNALEKRLAQGRHPSTTEVSDNT